MTICCEAIKEYLRAQKIEHEVHGENLCVEKLSAVGPDVKESLCYYVGEDENVLKNIEKSIVFCRYGLKVDADSNSTYIFTPNPQLSFYHVSNLFREKLTPEIHNMSYVDKNALIGKNVSIGPFCAIEECKIGNGVVIESGVRIHKGTVIGDGVQINSNSVIGETGIMWISDKENRKISLVQTGIVVLGDNVYIGSNVTVVRGGFENKPTIIEKNSMIGNGTSIAHGGFIGENSHLANNVTLSGSVQIGKGCFLGSACTMRPHIKISNNTIVGAGAVVVNNYSQEGLILVGNPAKELTPKKEKMTGVP